jgi:hypothetical protein
MATRSLVKLSAVLPPRVQRERKYATQPRIHTSRWRSRNVRKTRSEAARMIRAADSCAASLGTPRSPTAYQTPRIDVFIAAETRLIPTP